ncbi:MAG: SDR family oxidoreductase [Pseudomonadota bacterium]
MAQKILIVGASRGIGLELARQCKARGDQVTATVRSDTGAAALADLDVTVLKADIVDEAALTAVASAVDGIDLMICNAGIYRGRGDMHAEDTGADAWQEVLMTNIAGPFLAVKACLPNITAPGGKIAVISSVMGSTAGVTGNNYIYRSSKAGATNVACNLAQELASKGISVGAYHPGWVQTDMGGTSAPVTIPDSAAGLLARFEALGPETTGVFEDYQGAPIPY